MAAVSLQYETSVAGQPMPRLRRDHLLWLALLLLPLLGVAAAIQVQRYSGNVATAPALPRPLQQDLIGRPAPALALPRLANDATLELESLRGRPVIVNFWASWCAPCVRELPALASFSAEHSGPGAPQVLAVNIAEDVATIESFLAEQGATNLTVLLDGDGHAGDVWGARGLPMTFLIDPAGRIAAVQRGEITLAALRRWLALLES